jgi:PAS domain S-box-containing protein
MPNQHLRNPKSLSQRKTNALAEKLSCPDTSASLKEALVQGASGGGYAIIVTDHTKPTEPVVYVNHAFEDLTGYKLAEIIGLHPPFLTNDREQAGVKELEAAFHAGRACSAVLQDFRKNSAPIWYQVNITPVFNASGQVSHFYGYLRDVTAQIESEGAEEDMETFVASLAHDLRTPLAGADRMFALIMEGEYGRIVPELQNTMVLLSKGNKKALDLVRNLTESYRLRKNTGLLHFDIVDVPALIRNAVQEIEVGLDQAKIEVTIGENFPPCVLDSLAISRLLTNLLDNAVKFSPAGGQIQIDAQSANDQILLKVTDHGIGIHAEDRDIVFRKCKRNRQQKHTPGCGLGLYICKEIVLAHHGQISIDGELGIGTTVSVSLPIKKG